MKQLGEDYQKTALKADINTAATQALQADVAQAITSIAQYFRQLAAGAASLDDFGKVLIAQVGNIATKVGEALIAAGVGFIALEFALDNPYGAIAAGAALVAIGAALGSISNTLGSVGTSSAGAASSALPTVSNYGQTSNQTTIKIIAEFKLRSQDLVAIGRQQEYRSRVTARVNVLLRRYGLIYAQLGLGARLLFSRNPHGKTLQNSTLRVLGLRGWVGA